MADKYHQSSSKTIKVKCRLCKLEMIRQSYLGHLLKQHPEADAKDQSRCGEQGIKNFFGKKMPNRGEKRKASIQSSGDSQQCSSSKCLEPAASLTPPQKQSFHKQPVPEHEQPSRPEGLEDGDEHGVEPADVDLMHHKGEGIDEVVVDSNAAKKDQAGHREGDGVKVVKGCWRRTEPRSDSDSESCEGAGVGSAASCEETEEGGHAHNVEGEGGHDINGAAAADRNAETEDANAADRANHNVFRDNTDENNNREEIARKLEVITQKITSSLDLGDCESEHEVMLKRLSLIERNIDTLDGVKNLQKSITSLKEIIGVRDEDKKYDAVDSQSVLKEARSLQEITEKLLEFEYREFKEGGQMLCIICGEHFKYSRMLDDDFRNKKKMDSPNVWPKHISAAQNFLFIF